MTGQNINTALFAIQIILLILTACLVPIIRMWVKNMINEALKEVEDKYFSKAEAKYLVCKIDELADSINTMNKFLLENWSKR